MALIFELITTIRNIRAELEIPLAQQIAAKLYSVPKTKIAHLKEASGFITSLAKLSNCTFHEERYRHQAQEFVVVVTNLQVVIPLAGVVDIEKLKMRTTEKMHKTEADIRAKEQMLANEDFVKRAPAEIVEKEKAKLTELQETLAKLKAVHDGFR